MFISNIIIIQNIKKKKKQSIRVQSFIEYKNIDNILCIKIIRILVIKIILI